MARPHFDPTINFGHLFIALGMIIGGAGGAITVYVSISATTSAHEQRIVQLEKKTDLLPTLSEQQRVNVTNIDQLRLITTDIAKSNKQIVDTLTGIRVDLAKLQGQLSPLSLPEKSAQ